MNVQNAAKRNEQKAAKWVPPRGVRLLEIAACINRPYAVQWRIDGRRKTRSFPTKTKQEAFARSLAGSAKEHGVTAYRLDETEARAWRAFVAQLDGATLDEVLACWSRHGKKLDALPIETAVAKYLAAKAAEGVSPAAVSHYKAVFKKLSASFDRRDARTIERDEVAEWVASISGADHTRRTAAKRVRALFRWLVDNQLLSASPCDGLKPVTVTPDEVELLTVDQARSLFAKNEHSRELCGRLALEAFCGLRFSSAAQVAAGDIDFKARGIALPAAKIKTRRRQYIDGLPENLWAWLEWSKPGEWKMTPRDYMREKSAAFIRARVPHPHNCLRHSFASYHMAGHKDAGKTAAILCHTSPKMLYAHYKGRATESDGAKYFQIMP